MLNMGEPVFRNLPFMGVIRVNMEAMDHGYRMGDSDWCNLGQGQPEVGELEGAPARLRTITLEEEDHAYGPVEGVPALREANAAHYNRLYRKGKSPYRVENVAVVAGGRLALSRVAAALGKVRLGYFTPDYTAYEDLLATFQQVQPVHLPLSSREGFRIQLQSLESRLREEGVEVLLMSNPCNPTGVVLRGDELQGRVELTRACAHTLILDEFYSHYSFETAGPVSAAEFVEDVNKDPVILIDGLTKCFRVPGWRIGWVVAPTSVIRTLMAAGSFLDGGPPRPTQRAALEVLEADRADQETAAVRQVFRAKRDLTVEQLVKMGIAFPAHPEGTFYAYGSVAGLPAPLDRGLTFMREAFRHRVLTVPGEFFDVNPGSQREGESPLSQFVRFSYGPPAPVVSEGLDRIQTMIQGFLA